MTDDGLTIGKVVAKFDDAWPDSDAAWVAERAVAAIPAADRKRLLREYVQQHIEDRRRKRSRWVEQRHYDPDLARESRQARKKRDEALRLRAELEQTDPDAARRLYPTPWERVADSLDTFRDEVRLELTVDLLTSSFSLGDGRQTTWGMATVQDHQARIDMLTHSALGTLQTAFLHEKAVDLLRARQASCLNDVRWAVGAAA